MMKYHTSFDEAGKPSFSYFRERWIRNCEQYRWIGAVHKVIPPNGRITYFDIAICHKKKNTVDSERNLRIYRKIIADGKTLEPRQQYYYGRELYYHGNMKKPFLCLTSFCSQRVGGSKIK